MVEAIAVAVERGLRVPIVYNTSSYDALSSLGLMEGLVDIYMPDFKFWTAATSERLCKARKKERDLQLSWDMMLFNVFYPSRPCEGEGLPG